MSGSIFFFLCSLDRKEKLKPMPKGLEEYSHGKCWLRVCEVLLSLLLLSLFPKESFPDWPQRGGEGPGG